MKRISVLLFLMGIVPLFSGSGVSALALSHADVIQNFTVGQWLIVTFVLTLSSAFALTPPTLLAVAFGYFLGWWAMPLLVMLNLTAIALVYQLTVFLNRDLWLGTLSQNAKIKRFLSGIHQQPRQFVMYAKLSPILPFALTNFMFGLMRLPIKQVIIGGFMGMLPRTVLAVWLGYQAAGLYQALQNSNDNIASKILIVILVIVSLIGLVNIFRPKQSQ